MSIIKKIGIMTGGGDCPGLNAALRAVVRYSSHLGIKVLGFRFGWKGVIEKDFETLDLNVVSGILPRGGTFLGSSRINPLEKKQWSARIKKNVSELGIEAFLVIGGDGTLRATLELYEKEKLPFVAIPKTIDNDLMGTDQTFGFDTAVSIATEAIDRIHTTAESHQRVMIVEVMGRDTGWIATYAGIAGGADFILIPEVPATIGDVVAKIKERYKRGKTFSIVVVAEGAVLYGIPKGKRVDDSIGKMLAHALTQEMECEARVTILGHVQRGGSPSAFDRILATRFGIAATQMAVEKKFGTMAALQGDKIVPIPLKNAVGQLKKCDLELYKIAQTFFG